MIVTGGKEGPHPVDPRASTMLPFFPVVKPTDRMRKTTP
jgi:hypothetical protein